MHRILAILLSISFLLPGDSVAAGPSSAQSGPLFASQALTHAATQWGHSFSDWADNVKKWSGQLSLVPAILISPPSAADGHSSFDLVQKGPLLIIAAGVGAWIWSKYRQNRKTRLARQT